MYQIIIGYLIIINMIGFVIIFIDKQKAKRKEWRIKESTLLMVAIVGGSLGTLISMNLNHHKTRKAKFSIGVPFIIVIQIIIIYKLKKFFMV